MFFPLVLTLILTYINRFSTFNKYEYDFNELLKNFFSEIVWQLRRVQREIRAPHIVLADCECVGSSKPHTKKWMRIRLCDLLLCTYIVYYSIIIATHSIIYTIHNVRAHASQLTTRFASLWMNSQEIFGVRVRLVYKTVTVATWVIFSTRNIVCSRVAVQFLAARVWLQS